MIFLALPGCMTLDGFFFNGTPVGAYGLQSDVIPSDDVELVSFPSTDGVTLYGVWAHQPEPGPNEPRPQVLLYFHGNADNIDAYFDKLGVYWGMGYETFIFDYRGYGMSDGSPTHDTVIEDGAAAVDHVAARTGLAPEEVAFHGLSLGGFVAVHVAGEVSPKVLITEDMFATGQQLLNDGSALDLPNEWMLADAWDNVAAAREVDAPYLVIHGDSDTYIQPSHAAAVYAAANDPKKLWLVPGADHAEADEVDPDAYRENVTCWIEQTCPE